MRAQQILAVAGLVGQALGVAFPRSSAPSSVPVRVKDCRRTPATPQQDGSSIRNSTAAPLNPRTVDGVNYGCKCFMGDDCWPQPSVWQELNTTVNGQLIVNIPPGAPCYDTFDGPLGSIPTRDEAACANVKANFNFEQWTIANTTAASYATYYTDDTCRPEGNAANTCTLGNSGVYVIMAKTRADVKAGIDFARQNNVRLIIRNTGHDLLGRSTGAGALIVNTHQLKEVEWIDNFSGPGGYTGPAVKIGAGIQARDLLTEAHARNPPVVVVTGECPTVGIGGGFIQGGGHGPWATLKGFASDNVLAFEAVTASGEFVNADASENPDLFWALKGGGPSAYAIILSVTVKTFPDVRSSAAILYMNGTHTNDTELWWKGVTTIHNYTNHFVDNGLFGYVEVLAGHFLRARPFVAIDKSPDQLQAILDPVLTELREANVPFDFTIKEFPTFFDLYIDVFEDEAAGQSSITGGWMFTHEDVTERLDQIIEAMKTVMAPAPGVAGYMVSHIVDPGHGMPESNSATHPAWREASNFILISLPVPTDASATERARLQDLMSNTMEGAFRSVSKSGATYVHEADPYTENWGSHFWGSNYPTLQRIRQQYDPDGIFYAIATPGTENWATIEGNTRLCKKL